MHQYENIQNNSKRSFPNCEVNDGKFEKEDAVDNWKRLYSKFRKKWETFKLWYL